MNHLKISTRLTLLTGGLCLLLASVGGMGLYGLQQSHQATRKIYDDRVVPMGQLRAVYARQMVNQQLVLTSLVDPQPLTVARRMAELEANAAAITRTWEAYMGTAPTAEEKALGDRFIGARKVFLQTALLPIKQALLAGDHEQARRLALTVMPEAYAPASAALEALTKMQIDLAHQEYEVATASYARQQAITGVGQVNEAITQMDQTTQQNAALVEQGAAAAESLKVQAAQLVDAVAIFKLASDAAAPKRAGAAEPAWNGAERRGENRARNVVRPSFTARPATPSMPARATGTDGEWAGF